MGSDLLGSLAEMRGFVTEAERVALGSPRRPTTTDDPIQDLHAASKAAHDEGAESERLLKLYKLRVEVACHSLASLADAEIQTLSERASIPEEELIAARALATDALSRGPEERAQALKMLLAELGSTEDDDEDTGVNDLLGEVRKLGRWPGNPHAPHVVAYRRALADGVLRNARLAFWAARRKLAKPSPLFLLAALEGLREALERFDPHRGYALATYATPWIHQRVMRAIVNHGAAVRAPVYFWDARGRVLRAIHAHVAEHGTFPTREVLERTRGLSEQDVEKVLRYGLTPLRDVWTSTCENAAPAADALFDIDAATLRDQRMEEGLQLVLDEALPALSERQHEIIRRRYGIGVERDTLIAIGVDFEVSRERIRQLESKALELLGVRVGAELANWVQDVESA